MTSRTALARAPIGETSIHVPTAPIGARRAALHRLIGERGFVSVSDVATEIGISDMTVRRDFEVLEKEGLIQRSHGGARAIVAPPELSAEPSFAARRDLQRAAKLQIAATAATLVKPHQAIGLDIGSTIACLAAELSSRNSIQIVTNSLQTVLAMQQPILPEIFLLGGHLRAREGSLCGSITRQQLAAHWMDRVFIGVAGIDENGIYDYSPEEAEVKNAFISQAAAVTVLCDSSKFGRRSFVRVCGLETIESIVVDSPLPTPLQSAVSQAGIDIILAEQPTARMRA